MDRRALTLLMASCWFTGGTVRAAPPVADYGRLPAVENMTLSPSGEKIAWLAVDTDGRKLVVSPVGGRAIFTVKVATLKPRSVRWMGDDHMLVTTTRTVDSAPEYEVTRPLEMAQSTIIDAATGAMRNVFSTERQVYHATFGEYGYARIAGQDVGYFGGLTLTGAGSGWTDFASSTGAITHSHTDLYQVNLATGSVVKIGGGSEKSSTFWLVGRDGGVIARSEYATDLGQWRLYDGQGAGGLITEIKDPTGEIYIAGQGRGPGTVLIVRPEDGEWARLEYARDGSTKTLFGNAPIREELFDRTTGLLIGGVTNEDEPRTLFLDPALQAKYDKAKRPFTGERVELASANASLDRMVLHTDGPNDSGTYFLVDLPTRHAEAIGWDYPSILLADVAASRMVDYKAADGIAMRGVLTLPPGRAAKALPVIVMPHGGPEAHDGLRFDWWAQAFASRGYAVFQPNFRGSDGYGKAFRDAGLGEWGRRMQTDISDGLSELARQGIVDPKRACIVGASYGGYAALAGVTVQHGLYRCAVSVAGIGDLNPFLVWLAARVGQRNASMRYTHEFLGVKSNGDAALRALSPLRLASTADAPILLVHGKDDTIVPISQSINMRDALKAAGKTVELVELNGEDHWLSTASTRIQMLEASVAFVEKYNPAN